MTRWQHAATRLGQAGRIARTGGARDLGVRLVRRAYRSLGAEAWEFPLADGDIMSSADVAAASAPSVARSRPLRIGWVMVPPSRGSGGHTTAFRAIEALEAAGHRCEVLLYDRYDGSRAQHADVIRASWPGTRASIRSIDEGVTGLDALVATSWQTAHVAARHAAEVARCFYFVQDFEPYFYPRGAEYFLAEDTYRFGFHGITAGRWLADTLEERFGMRCDAFEFGADTGIYRHRPDTLRDGVVFYAKPGVPRRGYALGMEVLRRFHDTHPDAPVHLFGDSVGRTQFPVVDHGRLTTQQLAELYNRCRAGLSLSFTNVSLIPWELAACGVVPVVNDAPHNRRVLATDGVVWADESIAGLTRGLSTAYDAYTAATGSSCAAGVREMSWSSALATVVAAVERECGVPARA